jgi:heme oxygenase
MTEIPTRVQERTSAGTGNVIRTMLRARIATLHNRLDRMMNLSCAGGALGLERFLSIHYGALTVLVPALERAGADLVCPEWGARTRLEALEEDLSVLPTHPHKPLAHRPSFASPPEIWGALYALEGSRLGNLVVLRVVIECGSEDERRATRFLSCGSEEQTAWGKFVAKLDDQRYSGEAVESAALGAERVFETYLNSAELYLG